MRKKHNRYASEKACHDRCMAMVDELDSQALDLTVVMHDARIHGVSKEIIDLLAKANNAIIAAYDLLGAACGDDEEKFATKDELAECDA